jgi:GDPmannose 4,6-dehydratase
VQRDWGFAGDYTRAMAAMLEADEPADYVVATGESWSVREFAERAFDVVGLRWEDHVDHDPSLLRPAEIPVLRGDARRARTELGWAPTVDFAGLVERMVQADLARLT